MANKNFPIIDLHTDYVLSLYEKGKQFKSDKQINDDLLDKVNVKLIFAGFSYDNLLKDTNLQFSILLNRAKENKNLKLILSKKDFISLFNKKNENCRGMILHLEGADILKNNTKKFLDYYQKGLRSIGLTHSRQNCLAAGNKEDPTLPLTDFGRKIVKLARKLKVIVDLAHLNERGFYEVLSLNKNLPPFVSHTCAYKLCPDPRNLKNEQIKAVTKQGGVIGIFFSSKYVRNDGQPATIQDVINHFLHFADVAGVDNIAIGSDFGGITTGLPKGLENTKKLLTLINKLQKAGFTKKDIEKICYLNAKRVLLKIMQ